MQSINHSPIARSALHSLYEANDARMELRGGWHLPLHFGSIEAEVQAARATVAVGEQFGIRVFDLVGETLPDLADHLGAGEAPPGAAISVTLPGGEKARWLRLTRTHARLLSSREVDQAPTPCPPPPKAGGGGTLAGGFPRTSPLPQLLGEGDRGWGPDRCLHLRDISSGLTTLTLIGPRSPDLLARLIRLDTDPRAFSNHTVALTGAAGIPIQILRWDRGPLLAYEITIGRDAAEYLWEALTHAGQNLGLKLIGIEALSRI